MNDYTPTTEEVLAQWLGAWAPSPELELQFFRWLDGRVRKDVARVLRHLADSPQAKAFYEPAVNMSGDREKPFVRVDYWLEETAKMYQREEGEKE